MVHKTVFPLVSFKLVAVCLCFSLALLASSAKENKPGSIRSSPRDLNLFAVHGQWVLENIEVL